MQIGLRETWSKWTDSPPTSLPQDWRLASHQHAVYQAWADKEVEVIFDTALTGDGKTLAAALPLLLSQLNNGVFIYPTNELIRDQERQMRAFQLKFGVDFDIQILNGPELTRIAQELDLGRPDALRSILYGKKLILTNPDLFNLILNFAYVAKHLNPATIAQQFVNRYRYMVFDEFHTFDTQQVNAVLEAMLFIRASKGSWPQKYLFLSATPNPLLLQKLEAAGFSTRVITGDYVHGPADPSGYRQILQSTQLCIEPLAPGTGGIYGWVEANLERMRTFYQEHPHSKGLLVCNSVFAAKRVAHLLRGALEPMGVRVGENTGLTGKETRLASLEQDLVVATSTVDLGVDFRINFLVFESLDAGSFIQRLGRLGRHSGFNTYEAIALLPPYLYERFRYRSGLTDGGWVDRPVLFEALRNQVFSQANQFEAYIPRWGGVKATLRFSTLKRDRDLQSLYLNEAKKVYNLSGCHQQIAQKIHSSRSLLAELTAFRGAGQLDVWVHDPATNAVGTIHLLRLLAGTQFKLIDMNQAAAITAKLQQPFYPPQLGLFAQILEYLDDSVPLQLHSRYALQGPNNPLHLAHQRCGFYVDTPNPAIRSVNTALEQLDLCTCVVDPRETLANVKRSYSLPPFFSLHAVIDDETKSTHAVAFGQDALLLDSLLHWRAN